MNIIFIMITINHSYNIRIILSSSFSSFYFFVFGNGNFDNRLLPPNGVPGAGRAAADGDGLPRRLRGDARLRRQLRLHLPRLVHLPLPSFTHGRNVFQSAKIDLALHTQQQQSLLIPCCSKQPCTLCKAKCDNDCYCVS